jgi:hypothetical protein
MAYIVRRAFFGLVFLAVGGQIEAHELESHVPIKAQANGTAIELAVTVKQGKPAAVLQISRDAIVHLSVLGSGDYELHLHGYDITSAGDADNPAMFVFQAVHTGRFPIVMHGIKDLLGRKEKAVIYLEIRGP